MKKHGIKLIIVLSFVFALAACGGEDDGNNGSASSNVEPTQSLTITAKNWEFDATEYTVKAGEPLQISLVNEEGYHGIEIADVGEVKAGEDQVFTLEAGEYEIFCNVICGTGHADMVSTLIVQ